MVSVFYETFLSDKEKRLYNDLCVGIVKQQSPIKTQPVTSEEIEHAVDALYYDRPDLFFVDWNSFQVVRYSDGSMEFEPAYFYKHDEIIRFLIKLKTTAEEIIQSAPSKSEYDLALYLHDYLARHCRYLLFANQSNDCYNIVGALIRHYCVCSGFAHAYKYLCDAAGLKCAIIHGYANGIVGPDGLHAWNLIKIDGRFSYVDVTFDNRKTDQYCSHHCFLMNESQMLVDHIPCPDFSYPRDTVDRIPVKRIHSMSDFKKYLRSDSRSCVFSEYLFPEPIDVDAFMDKFEQSLTPVDAFFVNKIKECSFAVSSEKKEKSTCIYIEWNV